MGGGGIGWALRSLPGQTVLGFFGKVGLFLLLEWWWTCIWNAYSPSKNKRGKTESWGVFPGNMFTAFVFFRNEEKNNGKEAKGANLCLRSLELGKTEAVQLREVSSSSVSCWTLLLGHACKGDEMEAEQDLGEGREESEDVEGGGGRRGKNKTVPGQRKGGWFRLIRREHEQKLQEHTHTHTHAHTLCSTPSPPREKKFITPIFSWSGSQVIKLSDEGPILLSCSHFRQVHHVWNNEADLIKFSLAEAATLIWRWAY